MYDLIIIGGGPAGITAGIYAARQRIKTLIITENFGGQVVKKTIDIENYPGFENISGTELTEKFEKHLKKFDISIEIDSVIKIEKGVNFFLILTKKNKFQARAVIIASGASPRYLKIPGEKEFLGKGLGYCAICDGHLFLNKVVAVIGGGNAGFETAIFLSKIAEKIYILEQGLKVKADLENQEIVKKSDKIEIITSAFSKEIKGDKFVNSVIYQNKKTEQEIILSVQGVFVAIGVQPDVAFLKDVKDSLVDFNEKDEIKINHQTCETKTPGLFAAGDCTDIKDKQIVTAAGEGVKAVLSIYRYLQNVKDKIN
jgi:thioredoxin-disulfide reductase